MSEKKPKPEALAKPAPVSVNEPVKPIANEQPKPIANVSPNVNLSPQAKPLAKPIAKPLPKPTAPASEMPKPIMPSNVNLAPQVKPMPNANLAPLAKPLPKANLPVKQAIGKEMSGNMPPKSMPVPLPYFSAPIMQECQHPVHAMHHPMPMHAMHAMHDSMSMHAMHAMHDPMSMHAMHAMHDPMSMHAMHAMHDPMPMHPVHAMHDPMPMHWMHHPAQEMYAMPAIAPIAAEYANVAPYSMANPQLTAPMSTGNPAYPSMHPMHHHMHGTDECAHQAHAMSSYPGLPASITPCTSVPTMQQVLQAIHPSVHEGLSEAMYMGVPYAMARTSAVSYLMGAGYSHEAAHRLALDWEQYSSADSNPPNG